MTGDTTRPLTRALSALRGERQARGMSLATVSRLTGIDAAALSRLESGRNPNPTYETLHRYAAALGLELRLELAEVPDTTSRRG